MTGGGAPAAPSPAPCPPPPATTRRSGRCCLALLALAWVEVDFRRRLPARLLRQMVDAAGAFLARLGAVPGLGGHFRLILGRGFRPAFPQLAPVLAEGALDGEADGDPVVIVEVGVADVAQRVGHGLIGTFQAVRAGLALTATGDQARRHRSPTGGNDHGLRGRNERAGRGGGDFGQLIARGQLAVRPVIGSAGARVDVISHPLLAIGRAPRPCAA